MQQIIVRDKRPLMQRIQLYIDRVNARIGVEKALLFGSTARRKRHSTSDVDLIIVSEKFGSIPYHARSGFLENMWNCPEPLETLAYTSKEFEEIRNRMLMKEILSYAVDLTPKQKTKT
jgi:hypothetical protein